MKLIIGLGNPGIKYQKTRHNIGFITLDEIAYQKGVSFNKTQFEADTAEFFENGEKIMLVKPQTYMNESGRSIGPLMTYYQVALEDIVVIYDDLDLPVGRVRLRQKGSAGGHNGIKSLIAHLGSQSFNRVRIGIDRPKPNETVISHVLGDFAKAEHEEMLSAVHLSADASLEWSKGTSFIEVMNQYNTRK